MSCLDGGFFILADRMPRSSGNETGTATKFGLPGHTVWLPVFRTCKERPIQERARRGMCSERLTASISLALWIHGRSDLAGLGKKGSKEDLVQKLIIFQQACRGHFFACFVLCSLLGHRFCWRLHSIMHVASFADASSSVSFVRRCLYLHLSFYQCTGLGCAFEEPSAPFKLFRIAVCDVNSRQRCIHTGDEQHSATLRNIRLCCQQWQTAQSRFICIPA